MLTAILAQKLKHKHCHWDTATCIWKWTWPSAFASHSPKNTLKLIISSINWTGWIVVDVVLIEKFHTEKRDFSFLKSLFYLDIFHVLFRAQIALIFTITIKQAVFTTVSLRGESTEHFCAWFSILGKFLSLTQLHILSQLFWAKYRLYFTILSII